MSGAYGTSRSHVARNFCTFHRSIDRGRGRRIILAVSVTIAYQRTGRTPQKRKKINPQPPTNAELLPTTYSDLATFWRCEEEYRLRSLMDFSPGVGEQFGYGKQLHNILAEIHQRAIEGHTVEKSDIRQLVEDRFHLRYTRNRPLTAMREAAIKGLERYVERFGPKMLDARAVEKPFELIDTSSGALISGFVDLLGTGERRCAAVESGDRRPCRLQNKSYHNEGTARRDHGECSGPTTTLRARCSLCAFGKTLATPLLTSSPMRNFQRCSRKRASTKGFWSTSHRARGRRPEGKLAQRWRISVRALPNRRFSARASRTPNVATVISASFVGAMTSSERRGSDQQRKRRRRRTESGKSTN